MAHIVGSGPDVRLAERFRYGYLSLRRSLPRRGKHWELGTDNLKPESTTRRDYNFKKSSTKPRNPCPFQAIEGGRDCVSETCYT